MGGELGSARSLDESHATITASMKRFRRALFLFVAAGSAAVVCWMQPKSVAALSNMTSAERRSYLRELEASDVVGYYCGGAALPQAVEADIARSLRQDFGATRCSSVAGTRVVQ